MSEETFHHIAIVGRYGRFPGAADLEAFWDNLRNGVETISFFSQEELLAAGTPAETLADPAFVPAKSVLEDADRFDAGLFGYSPFEAERMDPQHRVFLEAAWAALEDAGYDPSRHVGRVGLFAGVAANTYLRNLYSSPEVMAGVSDLQVIVGNDKDFLATKASYKLDLRGPSVVVQTACSTSLVAIHLACQSLINHESGLALAGGVSVKVPLVSGYPYLEGGHRSPDGHCRAFDAEANGTAFGDGVGVVVLKRLADAVEDGDTIHAVIRGTAINNDGALKAGYTAPSEEGQAEVLAEALAVAGVEPESVGMIEAHGTGTTLGDPIEVAALKRVYGEGAEGGKRCALGSVKTNVGHLDAAAGVAGLLKAVLSLEHGRIPPSLHFQRPNPRLELEDSPFFVPTGLADWPVAGPRRAGVSSFGVGGTNAHLVLEQAPQRAPSGPSRDWQLLVLTARGDEPLDELARRLGRHLERHPEVSLADVAHTLRVGRRPLPRRRVLVARTTAERDGLVRSLAAGEGFTATAERDDRPVAVLFPGQGTQHVGMGRDLYRAEPVYRRAVDRCAELLRPHLGLDLRTVLDPPAEERAAAEARLTTTALAQPALFTVSWALAELWDSWGLRPLAYLGHSLGEWVAACRAGVVSLEDALALVAARGALMQSRPAGAMLAVPLAEERLAGRLGSTLSLAAVNGDERCVVSGPHAAVDDLAARLEEEGVPCRRLATSHAFHSAMMDPILGAFGERLASTALGPPSTPFVSNVTGTWITPQQATDPEYWCRQLRETVRFADGLATLGERQPILLEVGPGHTLTALARRAGHAAVACLGGGRDGEDPEERRVLSALGALWAHGASVDWTAFQGDERRHRVPLPTYPFERRRYWIERNRDAASASASVTNRPNGELRRLPAADWLSVPVWHQLAPVEEADAEGSSSPEPESASPREDRSDLPWLLVAPDDPAGLHLAGSLADALASRGWRSRVARASSPDERPQRDSNKPGGASGSVAGSGIGGIGQADGGLGASAGSGSERSGSAEEAAANGAAAGGTAPRGEATGASPAVPARILDAGIGEPFDPADREALRTLMGRGPYRGVVDLRGVVDVAGPGVPAKRADRSAGAGGGDAGVDSAITSFHRLVDLGLAVADGASPDQPAELVVVTRGLADVAGEGRLEPARALLTGPVAVLPQEEAALRCRGVDLPPQPAFFAASHPARSHGDRSGQEGPPAGGPDAATASGPSRDTAGARGAASDRTARDRAAQDRAASHPASTRVAEALADEILGTGPRWVALRGGRRYGRELAPWRPPQASGTQEGLLREEGVYLVTGGLGGLGWTLATHLARTRRARLVLTGRSPFPPRERWAAVREGEEQAGPALRRRIDEILRLEEETGARVRVASADVTDPATMAAVLEAAEAELGPLDGVFHAAGVAGGGVARRRTREQVAAVLAPKVRGALVLDALLADRRLDFVCLFSSVNAVVGGVGQVDYAAANAFLDALAEQRAAEGRPWLSLDWDAWREVGMAARDGAAVAEEAPAAVGGELPASADGRSGAAGSAPPPPASGVPDDPETPRTASHATTAAAGHPFLRSVERDGKAVVARARLAAGQTWVADEHRILGRAIVPGTSHLEVARALFALRRSEDPANAAAETRPVEIRDVYFLAPLVLDDTLREVESRLEPKDGADGEDVWSYRIASRAVGDGGEPTLHAVATVASLDAPAGDFDLAAARERCRDEPPEERLRTWTLGYDGSRDDEEIARYGPRWRNLVAYHGGGDEGLAELALDPAVRDDLAVFGFHPGLMDVAVGSLYRARDRGAFAPFSYRRLRLHGPVPERLVVHARRLDPGPAEEAQTLGYDVVVCDPGGRVLVEVEGYTYKRVRMDPVAAARSASSGLVRGFTPEEGMAALERILARRPPARVVVSTVDPRALQREIEARLARLREPESAAGGPSHPRPDLSVPYVAPRNPGEERLATLFQQVLGLDRVGVEDPFFELGGDSVIALQIIARAGKEGIRLSPNDLFQHPTVAALAERAAESGESTAPALPPIAPTEGDVLPLSLNQERYWARYRREGPSASFNLPLAVGLLGRLDVPLLLGGLQRIADRHSAMRTRFRRDGEGAVQVIAHRLDLAVPLVDLSALPAERSKTEASRLRAQEAGHVFDLEREDLFRITLVRRSAEEHQLFVVKHHLITDGWSGGLFAQELAVLYAAAVEGRTPRLPELRVRYGDFAVWQRQQLAPGGVLAQQLEYWRGRLDGGDFPVVKVPSDRPRGSARRFASGDAHRRLAAAPYEALKAFARQRNVTPFMVLLAAFNVLLLGRTGQEDLALTTDVANRDRVETEPLIGLFTNVLVLRNDLSGDPTVGELLERTRASTLESFDHQALPFAELMADLKPGRLEAYNEVFPVVYVFQNYPGRSFSLPGVELRSLEIDPGSVSRDLLVVAGETGDGLRVAYRYRADMFDPSTIDALLDDYLALLEELPGDPDRRVSALLERVAEGTEARSAAGLAGGRGAE